VEVGFVDTPGGAFGVAVAGGYAYVVGGGLTVIDVSAPSAPVEVGFLDGGVGGGIAVAGGYAYLADWPPGLRVIDVGTPSAPVEVGFLDGVSGGIAVASGYAYVAAWPAGLRVIDVGTPSAPVEVGFVDIPGGAFGVAVAGGYAYVADGSAGLRVIDVSTPSAPVEIGFVDTPGEVLGVAVAGSYAYVAGAGLTVIDVSAPSAPVEVGFVDTPGYSSSVAVAGGFVLKADGGAGLHIFNECDPLGDRRECFIPAAAVAAGAQGAFFQTDVELNNKGSEEAQVTLEWLPRGQDNSEPLESEAIALAPGQSLRFENALTEVFNLEPDSLGALKLVASTDDVIGMSRTYNIPAGESAGTFGQGLPAIRATEMITRTQRRRILFLSEDPDFRANVGCVNGTAEDLTINIGIFDDEGSLLETKTMELGPYSNDQLNHVLGAWAPMNGYVDVWADDLEALYYCYGSVLDNSTSDPTTILPQVPSYGLSFIPAAAFAPGLKGSFFQTDVDLNNAGSTDLTYELLWMPRGEDNSDLVRSDTFSLAAGSGVRYGNVLNEVFGLEPDQVGALAVEASGIDLLAMSRTYNVPAGEAWTFGQGLPGIPANQMIPTGVTKRILFLCENDDVRSNVGCINGVGTEVAVAIDLYDSDGAKLETKYMVVPPYSNRQINGIFQDYAPINGYVDVRTWTPDARIYCYGSVLDNLTSDPTTVLPQ
jgi:ethanolamine utilization microcompartment shell protein EutS